MDTSRENQIFNDYSLHKQGLLAFYCVFVKNID